MERKGLILGVLLIIAVLCVGCGVDNKVVMLTRPGYGEEAKEYELVADAQGEKYNVSVQVMPREIAEEELPGCFEAAFELVCERIIGNNKALNEVEENLNFASYIKEYGMNVFYTPEDEDLIGYFGEIKYENIGECDVESVIHIRLNYKKYSQEYDIPVIIKAPRLSETERFEREFRREIDIANEVAKAEELVLPEYIQGKAVSYSIHEESRITAVLFIILATFSVWYYKKFVAPQNQAKRREEQMKLDYSEIVSKLSVLIGAGMSSANAFNKIATDYQSNVDHKRRRYAYDEIVATNNRLRSGVSEADAYALLGKSCRQHCYLKLSSLLIQNTKKGNEEFCILLKNETEEAFSERKALARRKGEEAGTKLLLPMSMMLCVVLVIIIVPAFMSF